MDCWSESPAARPSFAEILPRLEAESRRFCEESLGALPPPQEGGEGEEEA